MSAISDLIDKVKDPDLRNRLAEEVARMQKQKKFGLVFEEHLPEATPLYEAPISVGSLVSLKEKEFKIFYRVKQIDGDRLICEREDDSHEQVELDKNEAVVVALFGQPIYPCLKALDAVQNAPDSDLWHTLIEADNYHALQLLVYLYGGKVDCIYIDPPYNTGDKSWKYNNNYVDSSDSFRHSKWLSMMKKRLALAKKLLNPKDSVLIVTIDEKEYLRLGCLLEEIFPISKDIRIQMVSTLTNPKGVSRGGFRRADEYIFFVMIGSAIPQRMELGDEWSPSANKNIDKKPQKKITPEWTSMMRRGSHSSRMERPGLYYAIYVNEETKTIVKIGDSLDLSKNRDVEIEGLVQVLPLRKSGAQGCWQVGPEELDTRMKQGRVRIGSRTSYGYVINYLPDGAYKDVISNKFVIEGKAADGSLIAFRVNEELNNEMIAPSQWKIALHNSSEYGTTLLNGIIGNDRFSFPKSLYAVHDTLRFFIKNKPNALIVDFFAGSGTTLHAVNLLNAEDGGKRRCIMVTNNEVSSEEETRLKRGGYHPGQDDWEKWGIARYVNWPRTKCSILGVDVNGNPLKGTYQTYLKQEKEKERTIKQITLIDDPSALKTAQKKELVAICCQGKLPQSLVKADSKFIVSEEHPCTILFDISVVDEWLEAIDGQDHLTDFCIVTGNNKAFKQLKSEVQDLLGNIIEEEPVLRPMSEGFAANAQFFKLSFLDKKAVAMDMQFKELLSLLWMKAGSIGECPIIEGNELEDYYIFPMNKMAILKEEEAFISFKKAMEGHDEISIIFIITDSDSDFLEMSADFEGKKCYQLYRDYLDNFSINYERN